MPGHSVCTVSGRLLCVTSVKGMRASLLLRYSTIIVRVTFLNHMLPSKDNTHPLLGEGSEAGVRHRV